MPHCNLISSCQAVACRLQQAEGTVQVWGLQAVQAVVNFKWNTWACYYLYCELACYLVWLLGFQVFTIIFQVMLTTPCQGYVHTLYSCNAAVNAI